MIRKFLLIAVLITNLMYAMATQHDLRVIYTTDVHGNSYPTILSPARLATAALQESQLMLIHCEILLDTTK